jgi:hypothetical protein
VTTVHAIEAFGVPLLLPFHFHHNPRAAHGAVRQISRTITNGRGMDINLYQQLYLADTQKGSFRAPWHIPAARQLYQRDVHMGGEQSRRTRTVQGV